MDAYFNQFIENITLTEDQCSDAQTKYQNVAFKLQKKYYPSLTDYDPSKKFLFGSYKTKTNVRPLTEDQDVDLLYKLPKDEFYRFVNRKCNGAADLLHEIASYLKDSFPTTENIKGWINVVLIEFSEHHHNIEMLPAFEKEDGTFIIPNSKDGGSFETIDLRKQLEKFSESNKATNGLTRTLAKMFKAWDHNTKSMNYSSFMRLEHIIDFLNQIYPNGKEDYQYSQIILDYFWFIRNYNLCVSENLTYVNKAITRAQNAISYIDEGKFSKASVEYQKIFGKEFPSAKDSEKSFNPKLVQRISPWSN